MLTPIGLPRACQRQPDFPCRHGVWSFDAVRAELTPANEDAFVRSSLKATLPLLAEQLRMELEYNQAVTGAQGDIHEIAEQLRAWSYQEG